MITSNAAERALNPGLYRRLAKLFGEVSIHNAGVPMRMRMGISPLTGRPKAIISPGGSGEYYVVNCPYCNDQGGRLWVNHRYGTADATAFPMNWLAVCYNEKCLQNPSYREDFYHRVCGMAGIGSFAVTKAAEAAPQSETPVAVQLPGEVIPLDMLPAEHQACMYLRERGFDPIELARRYGLGYCIYSNDHPGAVGRIIIPVFMRKQLVGWQARPPEERDWKATRTPKYVNLPGMQKRLMLYNYDGVEGDAVAVVEGVTSVWRLGQAVALLGKTASDVQQRLLIERWGKGTILVMLDGGERDATASLVDALKRWSSGAVLPVHLPDKVDPAMLPVSEIENFVADALAQRI